ncbi:hypothetical protein [Arthrobacter sp. AL12]|uniref:hypothetical protein n=1 Tax=Arthrobacter sp. AL12 TaxID=3042241 RepID=UPI00249A07C7|nr:hypothetical protein [Arthrobacter sp. AL12]MDI3212535.1 hypothetical protein [Arthrobacter sp. AL12]
MPSEFVVILAVVALLLLLSRLLVPALPLKGLSARLTTLDFSLAAAGLLGLILHCTSMFYRPLVASIPGSTAVISQINSMGTASVIWYVVPSLLLLFGLRRQNFVVLTVLAAALAAVGVTMYNGAALSTHLNTAFAAGLVIAAIMFLLVVPPWQIKPELLSS